MGKKRSKKKENNLVFEQNIIQIGNFLIKRYGGGDFSYLKVVTADGAWCMLIREDSFKYSWIMTLASEQRYHEILRAWVVLSYHMAMCVPDPDFIGNMIKEFGDLSGRALKLEEENNVAGEI